MSQLATFEKDHSIQLNHHFCWLNQLNPHFCLVFLKHWSRSFPVLGQKKHRLELTSSKQNSVPTSVAWKGTSERPNNFGDEIFGLCVCVCLYYITLYHSISYYIISCYIILHYIMLYHIISYYIILYYIILYYTIYIILHYITLHYITLHYIILYIILYYIYIWILYTYSAGVPVIKSLNCSWLGSRANLGYRKGGSFAREPNNKKCSQCSHLLS